MERIVILKGPTPDRVEGPLAAEWLRTLFPVAKSRSVPLHPVMAP